MIITDPLTIKLIDGLKIKHLSQNIKNINNQEFNYEETEYYNLLNLIIKLHVFDNLKENIGNLKDFKINSIFKFSKFYKFLSRW